MRCEFKCGTAVLHRTVLIIRSVWDTLPSLLHKTGCAAARLEDSGGLIARVTHHSQLIGFWGAAVREGMFPTRKRTLQSLHQETHAAVTSEEEAGIFTESNSVTFCCSICYISNKCRKGLCPLLNPATDWLLRAHQKRSAIEVGHSSTILWTEDANLTKILWNK